ncbi:MAG: glycosyltransferase, partial [Desulfuromonadaceae bacterium]|nr:glycosyltransferase [Desulfuromonadaceae bacterium]
MPPEEYAHLIICLTTYTSFKDRLCNDNVRIIALGKNPGKDVRIFFRILAILAQERPHIVHTYNIATLEYQVAAFLARVRLRIHAEHGRDFSDLKGENQKYNLLRRVMNPFIHFWVPVSLDLAQWLEGKVRIPQRKIALIYNGVDITKFTPSPARLQAWQSRISQLPGSPLRIVTVGRLDPVKDQATLLHALRFVGTSTSVQQRPVQLWIIGDGPERERLQQVIDQENLNDQAVLLGEKDNISELLNSTDVFVLSSLAEGIPMTVLEAAAAGLPVIATDVGGLPEIVQKGQSGFLVSPGSPQAVAAAIHRYLEDPPLLLRHGAAGRQYIIE